MPSVHVELTDTWDMWRQKTNDMIDLVYTLTGAGALSIVSPQTNDILVYSSGAFRNVQMTGDVTINSAGYTTISLTAMSKGRMRFAGSIRGLY